MQLCSLIIVHTAIFQGKPHTATCCLAEFSSLSRTQYLQYNNNIVAVHVIYATLRCRNHGG